MFQSTVLTLMLSYQQGHGHLLVQWKVCVMYSCGLDHKVGWLFNHCDGG